MERLRRAGREGQDRGHAGQRPGFHARDARLFDGNRMTYYGRWTYKFEEAAQGAAAAALIIHDTDGASYGWDVVRNSWSGPQYDLPAKGRPDARACRCRAGSDGRGRRRAVQGRRPGPRQAARSRQQRGFKPVPLDATASLRLRAAASKTIAQRDRDAARAARRPKAIVYMAHWDHLGTHEGEAGDNIYNGRSTTRPASPASSRSPSLPQGTDPAEALGAVHGGHAGGIGLARLEYVAHPAARQDRGRVQPRRARPRRPRLAPSRWSADARSSRTC